MSARVIHGDCTQVLRDLAREGVLVDSVVTDPPYHLASIVARLGSPDAAPIQSGATGAYARASQGFMGQKWDGGDVAFRVDTWRRVFDVMKPGAHLIAFAATKGYHRMACAIEDAGFEIRDMIPWLYGTGFPKSHDFAAETKKGGERVLIPEFEGHPQAEGWGTALKPAIEPVVLAQKPISEDSIAANVLRWGVGGLNIDACRIGTERREYKGGMGRFNAAAQRQGYRPFEKGVPSQSDETFVAVGRWPANLCHDGSDEVLEAFAEYGERGAIAPVHTRGADKFRSTYGTFAGNIDEEGSTFRGDSGTAARFFYSSKATQGERIFECRVCGEHRLGKLDCGHELTDDGEPAIRTHPTVKPDSLMRWYVEMVTPPGGLVLDPFAGTGTTAFAAREAGMQSLLIEASADHVRDIGVRLGIPVDDLIKASVSATPVAPTADGQVALL